MMYAIKKQDNATEAHFRASLGINDAINCSTSEKIKFTLTQQDFILKKSKKLLTSITLYINDSILKYYILQIRKISY